MKGFIEIDRERCKGCGLCIIFCPKKQIQISNKLNTKGYYPASFQEADETDEDQITCTGCALCAVACPDIAIQVYRQERIEATENHEESKEGQHG